MVDVSHSDLEYHELCINILDSAIKSCHLGEKQSITCINRSGYKVNDVESALALLIDFKETYLAEYVRRSS